MKYDQSNVIRYDFYFDKEGKNCNRSYHLFDKESENCENGGGYFKGYLKRK